MGKKPSCEYNEIRKPEDPLANAVDTSNSDDDCPCNTCATQDTCDGWEARFCCRLCYYLNGEPDCENCDPMDI